MKLSVDYPSVAFREGPDKVLELGKAIEDIGYDEIAVFDHVVMGYPTDDRPGPRYPPKMPVLEAIVLMAQLAVVTDRIGLATEVLVLPQRQPVLVAKQISTIDLMSQGRVRLGVGVGWQESEYDALEEDFTNRGRRMDEAIALLRSYWSDEQIDFDGEYYSSTSSTHHRSRSARRQRWRWNRNHHNPVVPKFGSGVAAKRHCVEPANSATVGWEALCRLKRPSRIRSRQSTQQPKQPAVIQQASACK